MLRLLPVLFASLLFPVTLPAAEPTYKVQLQKAGDRAVVVAEEKRTVIDLTSESGIGSATIERTEGPWPQAVTVRFRYAADRPFTTLEEFQLRAGRILVVAGSKDGGRMPFFLADAQGEVKRDDRNPAGWLNVIVRPVEKTLELTLPANLLQGSRKVELRWIDFFRN
jgi:hypothetical protein